MLFLPLTQPSSPPPARWPNPPLASLPTEHAATDHTLHPTHHIAFPRSSHIQSVQFSPDGATAYCLVNDTAINIWSLLVNRWPEVLGGLCLFLTLIYLFLLTRILRRPQTPGAPHCRRCNYNVVAQLSSPSPTCPECGVNLAKRPPRRGRSFLRRLWLPTFITALALIAYSAMHIACLPRTGWGGAPNWFSWYSRSLDDLALRRNSVWLMPLRQTVYRIAIIDTATGKETGTLGYQGGYPSGGMRISPDGRHLAYGDQSGTLLWISTSSGRVTASTSGGIFESGYNNQFLVGFTGPANDPWIYFSCVTDNNLSRLLRWKPSTGQQQTVIQEPAFILAPVTGGPPSPLRAQTRRYALLRWPDAPPDSPATISAPDFSQAYEEKSFPVVIRDPAGVVLRTIEIDNDFVCTSSLHVTPDGSRLFLTDGSRGIVAFDLRTGQGLGTLTAGMLDFADDHTAISSPSPTLPRLFVSAMRQSILVHDFASAQWTIRLKYPAPFLAPDLYPSPEGRWLAAVPFKNIAKGTPGTMASMAGPYIHELFLFDLTAPTHDEPITGGPTVPMP